VNLLADGETSSYESPVSGETLTFVRSADQVEISANYTEATATVGYAELLEAVTAFHQRVTQDLLVSYPGLAENADAAKYLAPDARAARLITARAVRSARPRPTYRIAA
jgi:hypothetical protein